MTCFQEGMVNTAKSRVHKIKTLDLCILSMPSTIQLKRVDGYSSKEVCTVSEDYGVHLMWL